ncbi:MAG TPA: pilin, partial [Candidatus Binatia bacterium]|nr:pilin [Candidatus Binatia bacterium]
MIQKLKMLILSLSLVFTCALLSGAAFATTASTNCPTTQPTSGISQDQINCQLACGSNGQVNSPGTQASKDCSTTNTEDFNSVLTTIINVLSVIVGSISVIMIIYGGFRYVTSAGNDTQTASARKTIIYALVGLIIVA